MSNNSCLQGQVHTTYRKLVEVFGEPGVGDEDKVQCEWEHTFPDGTKVDIYDWKINIDAKVNKIWNIRGESHTAVHLVAMALGLEKSWEDATMLKTNSKITYY